MIKHLFRQSLLLYTKASINKYGRETWSSASAVKGRIDLTQKQILNATGQVVQVDGLAYVPGATSVNVNDKIVYSTLAYKVINKNLAIDAFGDTHHIELQLVKYKEG